MDNEFNTTKKLPVYEQKEKSRRWSNCFGLVNKFKRLKNRLSTTQAHDALRQPIPSSQQKSTRTLSNVYPRHHTPHYYHQRHAHSASTIATFSPQLSSVDSIEQQQQQQQQQPSRALTPITAATYHLSLLSTTPSPSLSPPPRHGQIGRGRAFSDTSSSTHCCNDWRQFTSSYQKMTVRLSLDTESIYQQHRHQRRSNNDSSCMIDSPVDAVASVRDSMLIYQEDDVSTLRAHSNYSTISNTSSLTPQAPTSSTATSLPFRSGTLGHPQTPKKQDKIPSLPSSATLQQYRQPLSSTITTASSNHRQSIGSSSRTSTLSSIDLPLKERRRRRSPLMFGENDRLTLPIPRNDMIFMQPNSNMDGTTASHSVISSSNDDHATKLKSRERAMQQLEGVSQSSTDSKVISMNRIASTKSLDEQLVAAGDPTLMMNKAHYDAVVSRTIQQRRPSSPMAYSIQATTPPLLTQSASASMTPPPSSSGLLNKNSIGTLSSSFLPTPSSSSSPPPPPPVHHTHYLAHPHHHPLPTTPNSMDSYL